MRLLGGAARLVEAGFRGEKVLSVFVADIISHFIEGFRGDSHGVGSHIGDESDGPFLAKLDTLIQFLRGGHGLFGGEAELSRRLLLELARREGRRRGPPGFLLFNAVDDKGSRFQAREDVVRLFRAGDARLFSVDPDEACLEGRRQRALEERRDVPVFLSDKFPDFLFPVADDSHGNRLHAPGAQSSPHLVPENGADLISHQSVQDAPRLLGFVFVKVQLPGMAESGKHGVFRQVVEKDTVDILLAVDLFGDMPGDGFTFTVGIGCEVNRVGRFRGLLQIRHDLLLAFQDLIGRLKIIFYVDPEFALGEILDVTHRGADVIITAQIFFNGLHLGR